MRVAALLLLAVLFMAGCSTNARQENPTSQVSPPPLTFPHQQQLIIFPEGLPTVPHSVPMVTDAALELTPGGGGEDRPATAGSPAWLPANAVQPAAVWTGSVGFVFGGGAECWSGGGCPENHRIVRFDPDVEGSTVMSASLPSDWTYQEAVWTGADVLLYSTSFQGCTAEPPYTYFDCPYFLRYDADADELSVVTVKIPISLGLFLSRPAVPRMVWDGQYAYLLGGVVWNGQAYENSDRILRYDPSEGTLAELENRLPLRLIRSATAWDGQHFYLFGGDREDGSVSDQIMIFDPASGQASISNAQLPSARTSASAAWNGSQVLVFGGFANGGRFDGILDYDSLTDSLVEDELRLPSARASTAAVFDSRSRPGAGCPQGCAYIIGGSDGDGYENGWFSRRQILAIVRGEPAEAPVVQGVPGPAPGQATLTWDAPHSADLILGYHVYRLDSAWITYDRIASLPAYARTYTDTPPDASQENYYRVVAITRIGEGAWTTPTIVPPSET